MARNEVFISAPPEAVYELLSDPGTYREWVVGAARIRGADPDWPEPGTGFDHSVGVGPLLLHDETRVLEALPPVMLKLRARARPLPSASIGFQLQPEGAGTRVTMTEAPASALLSLLAGPAGHALLALRNRETLQRLKEIAEGSRRRPPPAPRARDGG